MEEFRINEYIKLKLEEKKTVIYINEIRFNQCKYLLLINPFREENFEALNSIDEYSENLNSNLEMNLKPEDLGITPEEEFRAHCSNLHAWSKYNYDTRLLHSNLSFPLLKKLTDVGDPIARKVFKEEIVRRLESRYFPLIEYLINERYIDYLERDELFFSLLEPQEAEVILTLNNLIKDESIEPAVRLEEDIMPHLYFIVKNRRVIALRLWYLPLEILPISAVEEISKLSSLESLQLSNHNVEWVPRSISNLQKLKSLDLNEIFIGGFPEVITTLVNLENLNLSANYLSYVPESIKELKMLRELDLYSNRIKTLPEVIGDLNNLEILKVNVNDLKELPESISNLRGLKALKLDNNYLEKLPDSIGDLENLETLFLSRNKLYELPDSISKLKSLIILTLNDNDGLHNFIEEKLESILYSLKSLKELDLDADQLKLLPELTRRRFRSIIYKVKNK